MLPSVDKQLLAHFYLAILFVVSHFTDAVLFLHTLVCHTSTNLNSSDVFHEVAELNSQHTPSDLQAHNLWLKLAPIYVRYLLHNHICADTERNPPTISYLLRAVLFCAALHPGKDTVMPDGAVVRPMLRATICTPLSGSNLPRAKIALPCTGNMHLYPTHWWHNPYKEQETDYL